VSLSVVADPFGEYDAALLQQSFTDRMILFKQHFVVDLSAPTDRLTCQNHLRNARKASRALYVERCNRPLDLAADWTRLYSILIDRHQIKGIGAFSRSAFLQQLNIPGIVVFRAVHGGSTVGMLLWYVMKHVAYYHLGAYDPVGYELRASFALFLFAIQYFSTTAARWLDLGGAAGVAASNAMDGLTRFKRGWSTGTRPAYFCGRILNPSLYEQLAKNMPASDYFPIYRMGEFR
jgi:hypothetical protein